MHVLEGFNACCFAFGQTGSGSAARGLTQIIPQYPGPSILPLSLPYRKTYTMIGEGGHLRGIIPRALETVFLSLLARNRPGGAPPPPGAPLVLTDAPDGAGRRCSVYVSLLEIYLDQIRDLGK